MKKLMAGFALLLLSVSTHAGVILQPVGAITTAGEYGPEWLVAFAVDQSGLSSGYTSGETDFATYLGSGPTHTVSTYDTWFSSNGVTTGYFDLDLGGTFIVQSIALWNESQNAGQGVNSFALYGDVNSDFSTAVPLGTFNATDGLSNAEVFNFTPTAMSYLRIDILSNHGADCCVGIMEVAVDSIGVAPNTAYGIPTLSGLWPLILILLLASIGWVSIRRA